MASDNNIFEVLQKVAENSSSSEKLFGILRENGYTGTFEDAGREIQQAEQVILENLTSEDLKNIAGGKSLMNDTWKKIAAFGGASLLAGSAAVSTQAATENSLTEKITKSAAIKHMTENPKHSAATGFLAATTVGLLIHSIMQSRNQKSQETTEALNKKQLTKFIAQLPEAQDLLTFLHLDLTEKNSAEAVKLTACTDDKGSQKGHANSPAESYVKIEQGNNDQGLLHKQKLLAGLEEKTLKLETLAVYMVYKSGGEKKLTVSGTAKNKENVFKPLSEDAELKTYLRENLTPEGQLLVDIIVDKLFQAQPNYQAEK